MPYPMSAPSTRTWLNNSRNTFEPSDLPGLVWWLDADNLSTLYQDSGATTPVTANDDPVGAWRDLVSGSALATQSTADRRQTYKVNIQNGKPGVYFDGVNDRIGFPADIELDGAATVVIVLTAVDSGSVQIPIRMGRNTGNVYNLYVQTDTNTNSFSVYVGAVGTSLAMDPTGPNILAMSNAEGSVVTIYRNGLKTVGVTPTASPWGGYPGTSGLGCFYDASLLYTGYIHEVLVWNRVLSEAEMISLSQHLGAKWAIPTTVPASGDPLGIDDCLFWFDASKVVSVDGQRVPVLSDFSGRGRHAFNHKLTLQGLYKTNIQNGLPAVLLDGTDDYYLITTPNLALTTAASVFGVWKVVDHEPEYDPMLIALVSNDATEPYVVEMFYSVPSANNIYYPATYAGAASYDPAITGPIGAHVFGVTLSEASGITAYLDNAENSEAFTAAMYNPGYASVYSKIGSNVDGLSRRMNGYVCEIMAWDRKLTPSEVATVIAYLATKWGISL